jgi:hypothetical protein
LYQKTRKNSKALCFKKLQDEHIYNSDINQTCAIVGDGYNALIGNNGNLLVHGLSGHAPD